MQEALTLRTFLEQMEAVAAPWGLARTGSQLHRAGHPEFRQPKEDQGMGLDGIGWDWKGSTNSILALPDLFFPRGSIFNERGSWKKWDAASTSDLFEGVGLGWPSASWPLVELGLT